jgi:hypothetical protein
MSEQPTLTQQQIVEACQKLESARIVALQRLNDLFKVEREAVWEQYYAVLDFMGLDKDGALKSTKPKRTL